jgi:hypothetical protein
MMRRARFRRPEVIGLLLAVSAPIGALTAPPAAADPPSGLVYVAGDTGFLTYGSAGYIWSDGKLADRVTVFTNWGIGYNTITGVGDLAGDSKPDLVVRDASGRLFRNSGTGTGSFTGRTEIATSFQIYRSLA